MGYDVGGAFQGLHDVQLAIPEGAEDRCRMPTSRGCAASTPVTRSGTGSNSWSRRTYDVARRRDAEGEGVRLVGGCGDDPHKPLNSVLGGAEGIRTPGLLIANETRYQLRHSPKCEEKVNTGLAASRIRSAVDQGGAAPTVSGVRIRAQRTVTPRVPALGSGE